MRRFCWAAGYRKPMLTVSPLLWLLGCAHDEGPAPPSAPEWRPPSGPVTAYQRLNPTDEQDRTIFRSSDGSCYVEATPPEPAPCPGPLMTDPAWSACADGVLLVEGVDPLTCTCRLLHDPQVPPRASPCAAEAFARSTGPARDTPQTR